MVLVQLPSRGLDDAQLPRQSLHGTVRDACSDTADLVVLRSERQVGESMLSSDSTCLRYLYGQFEWCFGELCTENRDAFALS